MATGGTAVYAKRGMSPIGSSATDNLHRLTSQLILQEAQRAWMPQTMSQLQELMTLPVGWDGYKAPPVRMEVAYFTLRMLEALCPSETPAPVIVPGSNGDLQVEWHYNDVNIELHVRGPSEVHAWFSSPDTGEDGEERELTINFTGIMRWINVLLASTANAAAAA